MATIKEILCPVGNKVLIRGCMTFLLMRFRRVLCTGYNRTLTIEYGGNPAVYAHKMTGAERVAYMGHVYKHISPNALKAAILDIMPGLSPEGATMQWCKWALPQIPY